MLLYNYYQTVYPLDYARTRLAADVGSGKRDFTGLWDCLRKTSSGPKVTAINYLQYHLTNKIALNDCHTVVTSSDTQHKTQ
eukprot:5691-Heterococcus_DN1.PRE.5